VNAKSGSCIATIVGTSVVVVAIDWGSTAETVGDVALVGVAVDGGADNYDGVQAHVARNWGVSATGVDVATIGGANVVVIAVNGGIRATSGRHAGGVGASVHVGAIDGSREIATSDLGWDTVVNSAIVAVVASLGSVGATSSVDSWVASIHGAFVVVVADRGALANSLARAESLALGTTRSPRNINASGNDEVVQDTTESGPIGDRGERSGGSDDGGGNIVDFSSIDQRADTNGEEDNSTSLGSGEDSREGRNSDVVHSIGEQNEDGRDTSSVSGNFGLGGLDTATNASGSSSLVNGSHRVQEVLLNELHGDRESSISRELNETHSDVLGSEDVTGCDGRTKVSFQNEVGGGDRTGFIEDEHEIDHLVALLCGAGPRGDSE
jgi:hypothetical protein